MIYYKNSEVAEIYKVSIDTVANWIQSAKVGKIDLALHESGEKSFIINTPSNSITLQVLAGNAKKFKNKKYLKKISPDPEFYKIFSKEGLIDFISELEIYREISLKFIYLGRGAKYWDQYVKRLSNETCINTLKNTIELLDTNLSYLHFLIEKYAKVNVIDIGPGNGLPIKKFLESLISKNKLRKYIAIDYSPEIIKITMDNMAKWFGADFPSENYVMDMHFDVFRELLFKNSRYNDVEGQVINIVTLFGGTAVNYRDVSKPLSVISSSLGSKDLFLYDNRLDSKVSRIYFDFNEELTSGAVLSKQDSFLLDLLGIKESFYNIEQYYDDEIKSRIIRISLKVDLEITFKTEDFNVKVSFSSGDKIILWRAKHQSYNDVMDQFKDTGFEIIHTSSSLDQDRVLVLSKIKSVEN